MVRRKCASSPRRWKKTIVKTVEAGFMTKDLALLVGPDQGYLTTEGFIEKVAQNFEEAMSKA
jgi:isocitrate dehydrogenase